MKPCPFCGGKPELALGWIGFRLLCGTCGAGTGSRPTADEAREAWNARRKSGDGSQDHD